MQERFFQWTVEEQNVDVQQELDELQELLELKNIEAMAISYRSVITLQEIDQQMLQMTKLGLALEYYLEEIEQYTG